MTSGSDMNNQRKDKFAKIVLCMFAFIYIVLPLCVVCTCTVCPDQEALVSYGHLKWGI